MNVPSEEILDLQNKEDKDRMNRSSTGSGFVTNGRYIPFLAVRSDVSVTVLAAYAFLSFSSGVCIR